MIDYHFCYTCGTIFKCRHTKNKDFEYNKCIYIGCYSRLLFNKIRIWFCTEDCMLKKIDECVYDPDFDYYSDLEYSDSEFDSGDDDFYNYI